MSSFTEYKKGLKDGLPICFGYLAVSFAFGIQAGQIGITALQAVLMSLTNVTSAGQFAALGIIAAGSSFLEMAITQFILNLRYLLMSCALSQRFTHGVKTPMRMLVAFGITDEIFGVSASRKGTLNPLFNVGLMTVSVFGWCFGTFLGVVSGNLLPASVISALGIAIYGMFIAIVVPVAKTDKAVLAVSLISIGFSCALKYLPYLNRISSGFQIIIATVISAAVLAVAFPREEAEDE